MTSRQRPPSDALCLPAEHHIPAAEASPPNSLVSQTYDIGKAGLAFRRVVR